MNPTFVEFIHISPVLDEKIMNADKIILCLIEIQYLLFPKIIIEIGISKTINPQIVVIKAAFSGLAKLAKNPEIRDMRT